MSDEFDWFKFKAKYFLMKQIRLEKEMEIIAKIYNANNVFVELSNIGKDCPSEPIRNGETE